MGLVSTVSTYIVLLIFSILASTNLNIVSRGKCTRYKWYYVSTYTVLNIYLVYSPLLTLYS